MSDPTAAPYGSWRSPVSASTIVGESVGLGQVALDGDAIYWTESRPSEKGRIVLMRQTPDGATEAVVPVPFSVRSRVHEYGGGAFAVRGDDIWFCNDSDQRVYRQRIGGQPVPLTAENAACRFADLTVDRPRDRIVAVRETHGPDGAEPVNDLVAIDAAGAIAVLAAGADFYAAPRIDAAGGRLAWLSWDHPAMPWNGCVLSTATLDASGAVHGRQWVAGGAAEALFQPEWASDGTLYYVSDISGWWNLYRWDGSESSPVCPMAAEFGLPQWVFNMRTYYLAENGTVVAALLQDGIGKLAVIDWESGAMTALPSPFSEFHGLVGAAERAVFVGGSADDAPALVSLRLDTGEHAVVRRSTARAIEEAYLSKAQPVSYASAGGRTSHAFYYAPRNDAYRAGKGELPPLIVKSHGGPTGQSGCALNLKTQFWTSRGFAVLDVNYGGSTGYGRAYRDLLFEAWGVVDVEDCAAGAKWLIEQRMADPGRVAITGGSAGGYTTLCALTFTDLFKAGASHYGIGDLEALLRDTHKFESRYLDWLIGSWPAARDRYRSRSPIHHTDRLSCPVIFFQGLDDKVVPPNQAESMVAALRGKGIPVAYLPFAGEAHGFRQAENIKRALEAELAFYGLVFGFTPADEIEPPAIENLRSSG